MMKRFLLVGLALLAPLWAFAQCTECASSAGAVEITVDATKVDAAIIFGYIPMSRLPTGIHDAMAADGDTTGATLRMETADASAECAIWVPSYVGASDTGALIWRLTGVSASVDTVYRLHHVPGATMYSTSATYGRNAVFSGYAGAWMPGVTTDGLTGSYDLTGVNTPGTGAWLEGLLAATYATNKYHHFTGTPPVSDWPITLKAIGYTTSTTLDQSFISLCSSSDNNPHAGLTATSSNKASAYFRGNPTSSASQPTSTGSLATSTYYYLAGSRDDDSGTSRLYVDGTASTTSTSSIVAPTFNRAVIGSWARPSPIWHLSGGVGFAGIMASVESADVLSTEHNMWTDSAFYSVGAWVPASDCGSGGTGLVLFGSNSQTSTANENWNDLGASLIDDATTTDVTLDDAGVYESETITYNGADLSGVPTDATSYTVTIHIKKKADTTGGKETNDLVVRFRDGSGTLVGDNLAEIAVPWPATATTVEYPLTGYTPDGTDFTSSTGVDVQATGFDTNGATLAEILTVWIEVDYEGAPCGEGSNWFSMWD